MPDPWRELEQAAASLNPHKPPSVARLGYVFGGTKLIEVPDDPSRVFVHDIGGGWYGRVLHKGVVPTQPVDDYWGMAVMLGKDEQGYDCIIGIDSKQAKGIVSNRGQGAQMRQHKHSIADIIEVASNALPVVNGNILIGNGAGQYAAASLASLVGALLETLLPELLPEILPTIDAGSILDRILTNADGEILVDADGHVIYGDAE